MNPYCPRCGAGCSVKYGRYHRDDDAQSIQRYRCNACGKHHSSATHAPTYRQKRRRLNRLIEVDIASSTAQRRIANGLIAKRSREKYGPRRNRSGPMRKRVLKEAAGYLSPEVRIVSDEHPRYANEIQQILPRAKHSTHRSVRGSLTGQGELKRTGFDPLFPINHTLAMMRDNIKRLARRTWCTTKKASTLEDVIAIYVHFHNTVLIPQTVQLAD